MAIRLLAIVASVGIGFLGTARPLQAREKVVAYVPNWINLDSFTPGIDYGKLTHINIAFENPVDDSGTLSFHEKNNVLIQAAHDHKIPVLISIGGGSASGNKDQRERYFRLIASERRSAFVKHLADYVAEHGFDGLDVDLEGPAINADYGAFVHELAEALRPQGKLLTAALSQGYGGKSVLDATLAEFDFVNIMAYDAKGSWNPNDPGQHSSIEFARSNARYWLGRGLPAEKAILGVPFYGYGFGKDFHRGGFGYDQIVARFPDAPQADQVGETIWYNGIKTIEAKAALVRELKLGGVMIWSLDNDVKGKNSLLDAIDRVLRPEATTSLSAPIEDRVGFPTGYTTAFQVVRTVERPEQHQVVTVYGNEQAARVKAGPDLPFPDGSILVMETRQESQEQPGKSDVVGLHVMRKERGFGQAYEHNRTGEWEYVEYRVDGSYITPPSQSYRCAECHVKAGKERDFVYRAALPEHLEK